MISVSEIIDKREAAERAKERSNTMGMKHVDASPQPIRPLPDIAGEVSQVCEDHISSSSALRELSDRCRSWHGQCENTLQKEIELTNSRTTPDKEASVWQAS